MLNPHRAPDCIYHLQVFLKSFPGFRNFRASHIQWVWLWVLEWVANYFSCIGIISPKSLDVSDVISILYTVYYKALPLEKYFFSGSIIITECWASQWAQIYFLNRVCGTSCMVINLSAEYFGLSKNSVTHLGRGLFALLHHVCSHLREGSSFLGTTRYISICYCTLKPLYVMQWRSRAPF